MNDELVIEFDSKKKWEDMTNEERREFLDLVILAVSQTGINLYNAGIEFEYWDHGGKSPHLHIHNLPMSHLDETKRALFKKLFIRKYVPKEFLAGNKVQVDFSLTGVHLIAVEWAFHWKGCYSVKKLSHSFKKFEWGAL